jgi:hypothetical protein
MNNGVGAESAGRDGLVVFQRFHIRQEGEQLGMTAKCCALLSGRTDGHGRSAKEKETTTTK